MSNVAEGVPSEYVLEFLAAAGLPDAGTIHVVEKGDGENYTNEPLDTAFHPESAVVHLIPKDGDWMDGQCYDKYGYPVYAE
jgi:hypothetical protein